MRLPRLLPLLLCVIGPLPGLAQDAKPPPRNTSPELLIAIVTGGKRVGSEQPVTVLEPLLQYRQGQWEQALSQSITGRRGPPRSCCRRLGRSSRPKICYARKFRNYISSHISKEQENPRPCVGFCVSEVRTVDSGAGPRLLTVNHVCDTGDLRTGGSPPFLTFSKAGHAFILADNTCYEGCDGFEVSEVSSTGLRSLASKDSGGVCD